MDVIICHYEEKMRRDRCNYLN